MDILSARRGLPRVIRLTVLLALWGVCATGAVQAQDATVQGRVTRSDTDAPVSGVEVLIRATGVATRTDSAGRFTLRALTAGPQELTFRAIGFSPGSLQLELAAGESRGVTVRLNPSITTLDVISTTATGDPRSIGDVPAAISLADTTAIRENRTVGMNEALRMMPGVQATTRFGTEDVNIGIRGSASRTRQAIRGVSVLLDGVPLSEPDGVARLDLVELLGVERIEVVRGPVSALYGGSSGGVVNVISRTGLNSPGITGLAEVGAYGLQKYAGSAGTPLAGGKGSFLGFGSYTTFDGYRHHSDGEIARGQVNAAYQVARGTALSIDAEASRVEQRLPGQLTEAEFNSNPDSAQPFALRFNLHRNETRFRVGGHFDQELNASGSVDATAYFYYSGRTFELAFPGVRPPLVGGILNVNFHRSQVGLKLSASSIGGGPVGLILGVAYDNVFGTDVRWLTTDGTKGEQYDNGYSSVPNLGIYGQGEWTVSRDVSLTFGLRYDDVSYRFESYFPDSIPQQERSYSQLSPRTTLTWRITSNDMVYASIARGFEVPAIGEISPSPGSTLLDLDPKSLWNFEVGSRGMLGKRLQYDAAVFYADVQGEFVPSDTGGIYILQNASKSRNIGVELAATLPVTRWLELGASYSFSDFRLLDFIARVNNAANELVPVDQSGNLLPAVPQNRITADVTVRPVTGLAFGLQCTWQSLMYVESGNERSGIIYAPGGRPVPFSAVPARALFQLNAQYQLDQMQLFASVSNLFGITYVENVVANSSLGAFYEAGAGRYFAMGVRLGFLPNGI